MSTCPGPAQRGGASVPKKVDHEQRRREIAAAVARLAAHRGLQAVSFREVAAEAGVSVSLVQHYFGTKENLLIGTLDIRSEAMDQYIGARLAELGPDPRPLDLLRTVALAFLPTDEESRAAMLLYLGFAAAALTDEALRGAEFFRNGRNLRAFIADQLDLARQGGEVADDLDVHLEAQAILALLLGLSLSVLLDPTESDGAEAVVHSHIERLGRERGGRPR